MDYIWYGVFSVGLLGELEMKEFKKCDCCGFLVEEVAERTYHFADAQVDLKLCFECCKSSPLLIMESLKFKESGE